jgi:hypothetical protein
MKKLSNTEWAKGMMDEFTMGEYNDWYEDFDKYFDMLSKGPLKGYRDGSIEEFALKLTILNDMNDISNLSVEIDQDCPDEPRWINIKIRYHYGS